MALLYEAGKTLLVPDIFDYVGSGILSIQTTTPNPIHIRQGGSRSTCSVLTLDPTLTLRLLEMCGVSELQCGIVVTFWTCMRSGTRPERCGMG